MTRSIPTDHRYPEEFRNLLQEAAGDRAGPLLESLSGSPPVSIRYNSDKIVPPNGDAVAWEPAGRYLHARPSFTNDPAFHAGAYYVQEASSMFAGRLCRTAIEYLKDGAGPKEQTRPCGQRAALRILDLCASPGGKTTHYGSVAGGGSLVVANEAVRSRVPALTDNVLKWGTGNVMVTNDDPAHFGRLEGFFDIVAVDAPCSGEGMFRKNPEAARLWSRASVELCAARQRRILSDAWTALRPGGVLLYSTCTFNRLENEDNVAWLAAEYGAEPLPKEIPASWGVVVVRSAGIPCYRFFPHLLRGEGFFIAAAVKPSRSPGATRPARISAKEVFTGATAAECAVLSEWVDKAGEKKFLRIAENFYCYDRSIAADAHLVAGCLNAVYGGVAMGRIYGTQLKPHHALAVHPGLAGGGFVRRELSLDEALSYLRRETLSVAETLADGLNLVAWNGLPIGWIKRVAGRANNLYPKSLMITSRMPVGEHLAQ